MKKGRHGHLAAALLGMLFLASFNYSCKKVQEVKQDVLEYSLNELGDRFFSMIDGDIPGLSMLQEKYVKFKESALSGQVSQNQIESVSANILNASNAEEKLTPDQAEKILFASVGGFQSFEEKLKKKDPQVQVINLEKRHKLGEGLKSMLEFNDKISMACKKKAKDHVNLAKKVRYESGERLQVEIDEELKTILDELDMNEFHVQIQQFEHEKVLKWEQDLEIKLANEQKQWEENMHVFKANMEKLHENFPHEMMSELKYLEDLDEIKHIYILKSDSIEQMVTRSLKAAGITSENEL